MKLLPAVLSSLLLGATGVAQGCLALAPSGQPALAGIRPTCRNAIAAICPGNPAFQIHSAVVTPLVPAGSAMFLLLGFPVPPPVPVFAPPLFPGYGLPGWLAMPEVALAAYVGVAGTLGNPAYPLPIPPGLCGGGLTLSAQIAVVVPGGLGLTGATGIVL